MMRVVLAATMEQREIIEELKDELFFSVFPLYFDNQELDELRSSRVLESPAMENWLETAEDACRVIAALQVLISLLKMNELPRKNRLYQRIFNKNKQILNEFQLSFPFTYDQFAERHQADLVFSMFAVAANELTI